MENQWVKAKGRVQVDKKMGRIALGLSVDFMLYYLWLIETHNKERYTRSQFGGHISIALSSIHKNIDFVKAQKFAGKIVEFEYNLAFELGGKAKGFTNYWFKVRSKEIEQIKKELNIVDSANFHGLHYTIATRGKYSNCPRKFQRELITIAAK